MITLEMLHGETAEVEAAGAKIPVRGLRLGDIARLLNKHRKLAAAFRSEEARGAAIVEAILEAGPDAINDVLDSVIEWSPGMSAAQAPFSAVDELLLLTKIVDLSMPEARVGKLIAEVQSILARLDLTAA